MAPKHKQLNLAFFIPISKEERGGDAKKEFASLNERPEREVDYGPLVPKKRKKEKH
jgi:hypothetical protein